MGAILEISLCIGDTKTRFCTYDEVELILKNGRVVKGRILPMDNTRCFYLDTEQRVEVIYPEDIKDYVAKQGQITVINCLTGDVLFQMTGKMSIEVDSADNQLEVIVEDEYGEYKKHFTHLGTHIEYVVEDITSDGVSNYHYTLNFNPNMWLPEVETID